MIFKYQIDLSEKCKFWTFITYISLSTGVSNVSFHSYIQFMYFRCRILFRFITLSLRTITCKSTYKKSIKKLINSLP